MSNNAYIYQPTCFLDTNPLQYMNSYLRHAKTLNLPPYGKKQKTYEEIYAKLREKLPKGIASFVMNGAKTLAYLQNQSQNNGISLYTSRLSKAEVLFGILDGQGHFRLAQEGISYRMRQRLRDMSELVSIYLPKKDFNKLRRELDNLFETLERKNNIHIEFVEESVTDFSYIVTFSEYLQSNVFLDVLDCWMFGCAVAIQADHILTFDGYFRQVINKIDNPQGDLDWIKVRRAAIREMKKLFPVKTGIQLSLPMVEKLPKEAPHSWN